jgi:hydroxypyruvate isomerase
VSISSLDKLSHQNIKSSLDKVHKKLAEGDFDGAISSARTLVEEIQVALIKQSGNKLENYNGDMNKLFQQTKKTFNLDPSKKDVTETLKQILSGLNSVVVGIAGISNMLGDRHATVYRPSEHHAKLAVNAALTFCEFLVDSYEYQKTRRQP